MIEIENVKYSITDSVVCSYNIRGKYTNDEGITVNVMYTNELKVTDSGNYYALGEGITTLEGHIRVIKSLFPVNNAGEAWDHFKALRSSCEEGVEFEREIFAYSPQGEVCNQVEGLPDKDAFLGLWINANVRVGDLSSTVPVEHGAYTLQRITASGLDSDLWNRYIGLCK